VAGLTIGQIDALIRRAYTVDHKLLQPGREQVNVTLMRRRLHRVVVVREDVAAIPPILKPRDGTIISRRGTASTIDMPSFENDVLHALTLTGGLPGEDARNEVWILRGNAAAPGSRALEQLQGGTEPEPLNTEGAAAIIRIPLCACPGEPLPFGPDDIVLRDGDVLFVQSRANEYDIDVVRAISMAGGSPNGPAGFPLIPQFRSGSGPGNIVAPTRVMIIRILPDGEQVKIYVDLRKALYDAREHVIIQPGDTVMAFWKPWELAANIGLNLVNFTYSIP
jgi:hypothetical protein